MAKFGTLINAATQIIDGSVGMALFDTAVQAQFTQVTTNKNDIAAIVASKGVANGIATLTAAGVLPSAQLPSLAIGDYAGVVASEAAMLAKTTNLNGSPIEAGDWIDRSDTNETYRYIGGGLSDPNNWKPILTGTGGVNSLKNASGSVSGQTGIVTLADVAFSGASGDVTFSHASYTAGNVSAALIEVMQKANDNAGDITDIQGDITNINTSLSGKLDVSKLIQAVDCTGVIDGTNKAFTAPASIGTITAVYVGGQRMRPVDYTVGAGNVITFTASPDYEMQRPFVDGIAA